MSRIIRSKSVAALHCSEARATSSPKPHNLQLLVHLRVSFGGFHLSSCIVSSNFWRLQSVDIFAWPYRQDDVCKYNSLLRRIFGLLWRKIVGEKKWEPEVIIGANQPEGSEKVYFFFFFFVTCDHWLLTPKLCGCGWDIYCFDVPWGRLFSRRCPRSIRGQLMPVNT